MKTVKIVFVSLLFIASMHAIADPPLPPSDPSGGGSGPGPVGAPIDGGLGILMAMGAAYGGGKYFKEWKKKRKEKKETDDE
jgi:hypothetical protein